MKNKILSYLIIVMFIYLPLTLNAARLIPECNKGTVVNSEFSDKCGFEHIIQLIDNVIEWLLVWFATPLAALIFMYAGFMYITSGGNETNVTKAKTMLKNVLIGYIIALAAWLIVKTIIVSLGFTGQTFLK